MQDEELYVKNHHFAFIKIAMLLLDCRTEAARERVLSEEFIAKGEKCLKTLETNWSQIAEGVTVQFYLASSDLEYIVPKEKLSKRACGEPPNSDVI